MGDSYYDCPVYDLDYLSALLKILREDGVQEFQGWGVRIILTKSTLNEYNKKDSPDSQGEVKSTVEDQLQIAREKRELLFYSSDLTDEALGRK